MRTGNETYLAEWIEGRITDEQLINLVGDKEFKAYQKIVSEVDNWQVPDRPTNHHEKILAKINAKQEEHFSIKRWLSIAATLLILVGLFGIISPKTYTNESGKPQQIALSDGTKITMEANSMVKVSKVLWLFSRTISAKGNLYFEVAKGSTFTINSPHGIVQILGTKFRIIDRLDYFNVACYEGKVSVKSDAIEEVHLTPGESIDNIEKKKNTFTPTLSNQMMQAYIFFNRTPLTVVLEDLQAMYNLKLTYNNLQKELYFSGRVTRENQQLALQTVLAPFHLELRHKGNNQYEIISKNNQ